MRNILGWTLALALASGAQAFEVSSKDIVQNSPIGKDYVFSGLGCGGKNLSPALAWSGAPAGTKSFAVQVYDPDAPTGSGFWHWTIFDIPAQVKSLPRGVSGVKGATQIRNDYGTTGYGGPCPPQGDKQHHYHFIVFAVDRETLGVKPDASPAYVGFNLHFHALAKTELVAIYGR